MASNGIAWSEIRKELYTPEELAEADKLKEQARGELEEEEAQGKISLIWDEDTQRYIRRA